MNNTLFHFILRNQNSVCILASHVISFICPKLETGFVVCFSFLRCSAVLLLLSVTAIVSHLILSQ